ncbi:plexin-A4-like [Planococcus citri]|uniref:plexin-A4-like n=1 Tax=Planococcus citri TaxID=170843 RepID=UPI0031F7720E
MEGNVTVKFDANIRTTNFIYKYINVTRDENGFNIIPKGIPAGGIKVSIHDNIGPHISSIGEMIFQVSYNGQTYNSSKCKKKNAILMSCLSPRIPEIDSDSIDIENPIVLNYALIITPNETNANTSSIKIDSFKFFLYPNPIFYNFSIAEHDGKYRVTIRGKNIGDACQKCDFNVSMGNSNCTVISISRSYLICELPKSDIIQLTVHENITVHIGKNLHKIVPKVKESPDTSKIIIICICILGFIIATPLFIWLIRYKKFVTSSKQMQQRMDRLEMCVAAECKEAFAELQTEIFDSPSDNFTNRLPFLDYSTFVMKNAFPNIDDHSIILGVNSTLIHRENPLQLLYRLIHNKSFLLIFIRTLESLESFSMNDRAYVASLIMIALQNKMEYCTDILITLLADLIKKYMNSKTNPKLLLRQTESMVEKMLSIWFTFLLYEFLTETAGKPLFKLFKAIKQHINKGPVDMITHEARYSLNEEKLLRQCIDYHPITVHVNATQEDAVFIGLESSVDMKPVSVLDCDSISLVKKKILDALCRNVGFSERPKVSSFELKWWHMILLDDDSSSITEGDLKRKNTLLHYGVQDGGKLSLISKKTIHRWTSINSYAGKPSISNKYKSLSSDPDYRSLLSRNNTDNDRNYMKEWHLVKPCASDDDTGGHDRYNKMVSEIYLTRLLATKGTLHHFVDDLFKAILNQESESDCFPMAIKYMFDFLDYQAFIHNVIDPEVVHAWKSNCLPLRFWVNLIKNPNFLFDVHKSETVDSCLSVVAQAFMDSFSTAKHNLGKDSPTSKLLYAKDIPFYKEWVKKYYSQIRAMPVVSRDDMERMLANESSLHAADFNIDGAVFKLHEYMVKYNEELMAALEKDKSSWKYSLTQQLDQVNKMMSMNFNTQCR